MHDTINIYLSSAIFGIRSFIVTFFIIFCFALSFLSSPIFNGILRSKFGVHIIKMLLIVCASLTLLYGISQAIISYQKADRDCENLGAEYGNDIGNAIIYAIFSDKSYQMKSLSDYKYILKDIKELCSDDYSILSYGNLDFFKDICSYEYVGHIGKIKSPFGIIVKSNLRKEVIVSFRGTTNREKDWWADFLQFIGIENEYYPWAVKEAKRIANDLSSRKRFDGFRIVFTGHSLGGGLATVASLATGQKAHVFNPAAISNATLKILDSNRNDILENEENIFSYVNALEHPQKSALFLDPVSGLSFLAIRNIYGYRRIVPAKWTFGTRDRSFLNYHSLSEIIEGLIELKNMQEYGNIDKRLCRLSLGKSWKLIWWMHFPL